ncbi:MAG: phosphoribosylformylglycinamidine synthase, partial [Bacteroidales bacterium]|nr:phosphoribosylformylglycinamidine synthase [Bacteroidales bacterium]
MIVYFQKNKSVFVVETEKLFNPEESSKLIWLFSNAKQLSDTTINGVFMGPHREMITPWSTNAVEITQNMGLNGIKRIEELVHVLSPFHDIDDISYAKTIYDPMLQQIYQNPNQSIFYVDIQPEPIRYIDDIKKYTLEEGLALSEEEIVYLENLSIKINRKLTDSEIFGFSQVNSEHCRHKIFNGIYVIDGQEKTSSLFQLIKKTSKQNPNRLVSAYKDNVAFVNGPISEQFAPKTHDKPDYFETREIETVISIKAETHNFPTTVEPFNGAATGSGGEIRDRIAGGIGSYPMAGTAVYMTSYPRLDDKRTWEKASVPRNWLYQSPEKILIKASNGASDFGNKFGQPLINGSLLTFEHSENNKQYGYDKVIMLAGGIGHANKAYALKNTPEIGDAIVVLGGDNYRIGMGGGAVSSVATGEFSSSIELNAVQRSNPEMQKRVYNAIRAMAESENNPIVSLHDHGAGGHLNCLSELLEDIGGKVSIDKLPIGDNTLSAKEIIGNESQERMGLLIKSKDVNVLESVAKRERAPMYAVGNTTGDFRLVFSQKQINPIDLAVQDMLGNPPKTVIQDQTVNECFVDIPELNEDIEEVLEKILRLESVACKDWLTNKVDRSVTGKVARQQCCGPLQLPLSNLGAVAIDFKGEKGIGVSIGHASIPALINPASGSMLSIAEALTNIVWAPLSGGLEAVSLSANWMWPCKNKGEDARLYKAVEAASDFACALGINIPTGKDSLSMTQKYPNGDVVYSPGTVIISGVAEIEDVKKIITPVLKAEKHSVLLYIDFSSDNLKLGGSCYAQINNVLGNDTPTVNHPSYFKKAFNGIQQLIREEKILAGHDISAGGMITALLEMCFAETNISLDVDLSVFSESNIEKILFAENPGVLIQLENNKEVFNRLRELGIAFTEIAKVSTELKQEVRLKHNSKTYTFDIDYYRNVWFETSYLLDCKQSGENKAKERFDSIKKNVLKYTFPYSFSGEMEACKRKVNAAILREQGTNGDREMAYALYKSGFNVKDVHISDLIEGREDLADISFLVFPGGFANSDVLGSAKGWAGAFIYNAKANKALKDFYKRDNTLSLGVCNGCQLMVELGLLYPSHKEFPHMKHNDTHKFESGFVNVDILPTNAVMLSGLENSSLGIWIAHGEGKFHLPYAEENYSIPMKYTYASYPGNPNGSKYNAAAICSEDGRHLAMMPHLERAVFPWQWAHYPADRKMDAITPWMHAFIQARKWIENK